MKSLCAQSLGAQSLGAQRLCLWCWVATEKSLGAQSLGAQTCDPNMLNRCWVASMLGFLALFLRSFVLFVLRRWAADPRQMVGG